MMMNKYLHKIAFTALVLALQGCVNVDEMFKGADNATPPSPLPEIQSTLSVSNTWSKSIGSAGNKNFVNLKPILVDGYIYVASREGTVTAIDADSGRSKWEVKTNARLGGGPGVGDGLVLLGSSEGEVIALDVSDGTEVWRSRATSEVLSVPSAAGGITVARAIDGRLLGLSSENGKRLWTYDREVPTLTLRGSSSPVIAGALIVYGSDGGKLAALSLKNGLPLWEKSVAFPTGRSELDRIVDIDGNPVVVNGVIYAASYQSSVVALELETSRTIWSKDLSTSSDMSVDLENLYVTDAEGSVWALDRRTGSSLWKQDKLKFRGVTGPVVIGKHVVVNDFEGYQHWLSVDDGQFVARISADNAGVSSTSITDGKAVYSYSNKGQLSSTRAN